MIYTQVLLPIVIALTAANNRLSPSMPLQIEDRNLKRAIEWITPHVTFRSESGEIRYRSSRNEDKINQYLRNKGFDLQCHECGALTVTAILDLDFPWKTLVKKSSITITDSTGKNCTYPALSLEENCTIHKQFDENQQSYDITAETENGNYVEFNNLIFPMIDHNKTAPLDYLIGLKFAGYSIQKAEQQTQLKIDEKGAYLKSAVLLSLTNQPVKKTGKTLNFIRNNLRTISISHAKMKDVFLTAKIDFDDWKQPEIIR